MYSYTPVYDFFNFIYLWDDFYEALNNELMNDLFGLFLSYYYFNNNLLIIFGFLIFLASVICINLLKLTKNISFDTTNIFLKLFNFFNDFINFNFLRVQNLFKQNLKKPNVRIIKKK